MSLSGERNQSGGVSVRELWSPSRGPGGPKAKTLSMWYVLTAQSLCTDCEEWVNEGTAVPRHEGEKGVRSRFFSTTRGNHRRPELCCDFAHQGVTLQYAKDGHGRSRRANINYNKRSASQRRADGSGPRNSTLLGTLQLHLRRRSERSGGEGSVVELIAETRPPWQASRAGEQRQ